MHHQQSCVVDSEISFYWPQYRPLLIQAQFFISPRPCLIITFSYWLIVMLVLIHIVICAVHFRNHLNKHLCHCALWLIIALYSIINTIHCPIPPAPGLF